MEGISFVACLLQFCKFWCRFLILLNKCILLQVEIEGTTTEPGTTLRAPTMEAGLVPACKDTCYGDLKLQLWEKKDDGGKGKV